MFQKCFSQLQAISGNPISPYRVKKKKCPRIRKKSKFRRFQRQHTLSFWCNLLSVISKLFDVKDLEFKLKNRSILENWILSKMQLDNSDLNAIPQFQAKSGIKILSAEKGNCSDVFSFSYLKGNLLPYPVWHALPPTNPNSSDEKKFQELLTKHDDDIPDKLEQKNTLIQ